MPYHRIKPGECLANLADRYRLKDYRSLYHHPNNADLRRARPNPNILFAGDLVFVPDLVPKTEDRNTDARHTFEVIRPTVRIRLVLKDTNEQPYASKRYRLAVQNKVMTGDTTVEGLIEQVIPADASAGELTLWIDSSNENALRISLSIGYLDPVEKIEGVQARLNNLGFSCGKVDGILGEKTLAALHAFQTGTGLSTRELDDETRQKIVQVHDREN
jgi:Putative peptidoglycan binding domain